MKDLRLPAAVTIPAAIGLVGVLWLMRRRSGDGKKRINKAAPEETESASESSNQLHFDEQVEHRQIGDVVIPQQKISEGSVFCDRGTCSLKPESLSLAQSSVSHVTQGLEKPVVHSVGSESLCHNGPVKSSASADLIKHEQTDSLAVSSVNSSDLDGITAGAQTHFGDGVMGVGVEACVQENGLPASLVGQSGLSRGVTECGQGDGLLPLNKIQEGECGNLTSSNTAQDGQRSNLASSDTAQNGQCSNLASSLTTQDDECGILSLSDTTSDGQCDSLVVSLDAACDNQCDIVPSTDATLGDQYGSLTSCDTQENNQSLSIVSQIRQDDDLVASDTQQDDHYSSLISSNGQQDSQYDSVWSSYGQLEGNCDSLMSSVVQQDGQFDSMMSSYHTQDSEFGSQVSLDAAQDVGLRNANITEYGQGDSLTTSQRAYIEQQVITAMGDGLEEASRQLSKPLGHSESSVETVTANEYPSSGSSGICTETEHVLKSGESDLKRVPIIDNVLEDKLDMTSPTDDLHSDKMAGVHTQITSDSVCLETEIVHGLLGSHNAGLLEAASTGSLESATTEPLESATTEPLESATTEPLESATTELLESATTEPLESATTEPLESATTELLESATTELLESSITEPLESANTELLESATIEPLKSSTTEPLESATTEPLESATTELLESATTELLESANTEPLESAKAEPLESAKAEPLESAKAEVSKSANTELLESANTELLKSASTELLESSELLESADAEPLESANTALLESPNAEPLEAANTQLLEGANAQLLEAANTQLLEGANAQLLEAANTHLLEGANAQLLEAANTQLLEAANAELLESANAESLESANTELLESANTEALVSTANISLESANSEYLESVNIEPVEPAESEQVVSTATLTFKSANSEYLVSTSVGYLEPTSLESSHSSKESLNMESLEPADIEPLISTTTISLESANSVSSVPTSQEYLNPVNLELEPANTESLESANTECLESANNESLVSGSVEYLEPANLEHPQSPNTESLESANTECLESANNESLASGSVEYLEPANLEHPQSPNTERLESANTECLESATTDQDSENVIHAVVQEGVKSLQETVMPIMPISNLSTQADSEPHVHAPSEDLHEDSPARDRKQNDRQNRHLNLDSCSSAASESDENTVGTSVKTTQGQSSSADTCIKSPPIEKVRKSLSWLPKASSSSVDSFGPDEINAIWGVESAGLNLDEELTFLDNDPLDTPADGKTVMYTTTDLSAQEHVPAAASSACEGSMVVAASSWSPGDTSCDNTVADPNVKDGALGKSISPVCDNNSEGSNDSGRGGSEHDMVCQGGEVLVHFNFCMPSELCGQFIGKHGKNINYLKSKTGAHVSLTSQAFMPEYQICQIVGTQAEVDDALSMIRRKFPLQDYPHLTMDPVDMSVPLPLQPDNQVVYPEVMQLSLPEGVSVDVFVSAVVDAGQVFVQQPTHRSYMSLEKMNYFLNLVYSQDPNVPSVPLPIESGVICVCESEGYWYRAMIMSPVDENGEVQLKFVDYGGYITLPVTSLKQIRVDFMHLPFQAVECFMANITPNQDEKLFSDEATQALCDLTQGKLLQCQVVARTEYGVPYIHLYQVNPERNSAVLINRALVNRRLVRWIEIL